MGKQTPRIQMSVFFESATGTQEEKDGKTRVCDKRDRATTK